jgi:hypothetical protein
MIERAIYSLWTKPMNDEFTGFNTEQSLMECFSLSVNYSKKWFKEVHLITDLKGKELVEDYNLSFDHINTDLEEVLNDVDKKNWAIGKLYSMKIQDKPFLHIDNDVILFKKLPDEMLKKEILFQCSEKEVYPYYRDLLDFDEINFKDKPSWYNTKKVEAYNCGIVGMNRLDLLEEWWESALSHIEYLKKIGGYGDIRQTPCLVFEQQYVGCLVEHYFYDIGMLSDYSENKHWVEDDIAEKLGYTHLISDCKRDPKVEKKIKDKLKKKGIVVKKNNKELNIY